MEQLNTIQKRNTLNEVYKVDAPGAGGASHHYVIVKAGAQPSDRAAGYLDFEDEDVVGEICFQHGPRNELESAHGVLDCDLLEIVRDRLRHLIRARMPPAKMRVRSRILRRR